jgi:phosphatidylinositol alpha-1,6-mannosyltransferase
MTHDLDLFALFPSFESEVFGGVQASGRIAWQAITSQSLRAEAFYYEPGVPRLAALLRATGRRVDTETLLVWHLGLLKLAPFIASSAHRRVVFLHGIEAWRKQDPLTRRLMRTTDLFISNSEYTWTRFLSVHPYCVSRPHVTTHLGIGEPVTRTPLLPDGPPAALMIGRLSRADNYKGHREIIRIWPRILERMPSAELWIVGGGDLRPELEQLSNTLGLTRCIRFFGVLPEAGKEDLLARCRVLVLPSAAEGFGLVYLEAMRMGRPCIVSTLDAGAEVVNPPEAGVAVDLKDPAQTASTILRLLTRGSEWEQIALRARQRYESSFTATHFEQRLLAALSFTNHTRVAQASASDKR